MEIRTLTNSLAAFRCTHLAGAPENWPISLSSSSHMSSCHMMTSVPTHVKCPISVKVKRLVQNSREIPKNQVIPKKERRKKVCQQRKSQSKCPRKCQRKVKDAVLVRPCQCVQLLLCQVKLFLTILIVVLQAVDHVARCHVHLEHVGAHRDELIAVTLLPMLLMNSRAR